MRTGTTSYSGEWLQPIVSISLVFVGLVAVLTALLSMSHDADAVHASSVAHGRSLGLAGQNEHTARLFIFYGWPTLVNGCGGDVDCAVDQFRQFELGVFGAGLEDPTHPDHVPTTEIITQVHEYDTDAYGYVDLTLELTTIITSVDNWADMEVSGIMLDRAGSEFGITRTKFCTVVNYIHDIGIFAMANAWKASDVLADDPPGTPTCLGPGDWYLAESWPVLLDQCDFYPWCEKGQELADYRDQLGIRIAAIATSDYGPCDNLPDYPPFRHSLWANYLFGFSAFGFTNSLYSASGPYTNELCPLPDLPTEVGLEYLTPVSGPVTIDNIPTYWRLTDRGTIYVLAGGNDTCDGEFVQPTLLVSKYAEPDPARFGESLTFTIRITNTSPATLAAIMTDILPSQVSPSGLLTRPLTINPLETREEQIVVTVQQQCGCLVNSIEVASREGASGSITSTQTQIDGTCQVSLPIIWKDQCYGNSGLVVGAEDCEEEDG